MKQNQMNKDSNPSEPNPEYNRRQFADTLRNSPFNISICPSFSRISKGPFPLRSDFAFRMRFPISDLRTLANSIHTSFDANAIQDNPLC